MRLLLLFVLFEIAMLTRSGHGSPHHPRRFRHALSIRPVREIGAMRLLVRMCRRLSCMGRLDKQEHAELNRLFKIQRTIRTPGLSRPMDRLGLSESVPCPVPPVDWVHGSIVHPGGSLLKSLHEHGRDARLEFNAATHVYKIDGLPTLGSVTGLVHAFAHPFDADLIIPRMIHGRRWPRPGYLKDEPPIDTVAAFSDYSAGREILQLLSSEPRDEERICIQAQVACAAHPELKDAVRGLGLDSDAIKEQWDQHRREAANRGTYMHLLFELWLNRCCSVIPASTSGAHLHRSHHIGAWVMSCC